MGQQVPAFIGTKRSRLAHCETAEPKRAHPDTHQSANRKSEHEQTSTNLPLASFHQNEREIRVAGIGIETNIADLTG
jgi:hypothetical protein